MGNWSPETKINPKTGKPINWQKPKATHPWRQYANIKVEEARKEAEEEKVSIISVKEFLQQSIDNWDKTELTIVRGQKDKSMPLCTASQKRQALYIVGILKRNYGS